MNTVFEQQAVSKLSKYTAYVYFALTMAISGLYAERISLYMNEVLPFSLVLYSAPFLLAMLLKLLLEPIIVNKADVLLRPRRQFLFDMGLYALIAILLFVAHSVFFMEPLIVVIKMIVGTMVIGYFASIDNALVRERYWFVNAEHESKKSFSFSPLSSKLSLFLTVTVFIGMTLTGLVAFVDLGYFKFNSGLNDDVLVQIFVTDIFFVFGIVLVLTLRLIHSFSQNIQHVFSTQLSVLKNVQSGNLSHYVPIVTRDEFGLLAQQINTMIDSL